MGSYPGTDFSGGEEDLGATWTGPQSRAEPDLRFYLAVLWRHRWILVIGLVLLPLAVFGISSRFHDAYRAKATVEIQPQSTDASPEQALASAARITSTVDVAGPANRMLVPPANSLPSLLRQVTVTSDSTAGFLTIAAGDQDRRRAADIANAFAVALVQARSVLVRAQIGGSIAGLETALAQTPGSDTHTRTQLSGQLQRLRAVRTAEFAQIVERARAPSSPVSPRPVRNAAVAFVIGGLVAVGLAFLLDRYDRRIRDPAELEGLSSAPLLGAIPPVAEWQETSIAEAFQMLAANLTSFNVDRELGCVLVASPMKADGKTTVAILLAQAMARAGKDVILVDADLRQPEVGLRFAHDAGSGLGDVLRGEVGPDDVLTEVDITAGRLRVLPGGPPISNPSRLMASERLDTLLSELKRQADLVIIDSAAALVVGDTVPLLKRASGVVLVGRIGWTARDAVARLVAVIANAGGTVLGAVATEATPREPYDYGRSGRRGLRGRFHRSGSPAAEQEADSARTSVHRVAAGQPSISSQTEEPRSSQLLD